jgi:hypothetical protein
MNLSRASNGTLHALVHLAEQCQAGRKQAVQKAYDTERVAEYTG